MILRSQDPNFILRPARESDLRSWFTYHKDKEISRNFMSIPKTLKEARKELLKKKKNSQGFVIDVDGGAVGSIGIHSIVKKHKGVISFWIARKCRGKGIMTKAVKMVTNYFLKKYKLKRISGNVRTFNKASARVLEKAGYKLEGILRKNKMKNGKFMDDLVFAKVK